MGRCTEQYKHKACLYDILLARLDFQHQLNPPPVCLRPCDDSGNTGLTMDDVYHDFRVCT